MPPLPKLKTVDDDSSAVATSMVSSCAKVAGHCARSAKVRMASCGSSPWSASWMLLSLLDADGCTLWPIRVTPGRGESKTPIQRSTPLRPRALQNSLRIAGMHGEAIVMARLGKGLNRNGLRLADAVLAHQQRHRTGPRFLKRQLHLELIGLDAFPLSLQHLARRVLEHDAVDAADAVRPQVNGILPADHQCVFVTRGKFPGLRARIHQHEAWAPVAFKAPITLQRRAT